MSNPFYKNKVFLEKEKCQKKNKFLLTFLPGSRLSELKKAIPLFTDIIKKLNHKEFNFIFVFANKFLHSKFSKRLINDPSLTPYNINYKIGNAVEHMRKSDISIMSSGTIALEAFDKLQLRYCL